MAEEIHPIHIWVPDQLPGHSLQCSLIVTEMESWALNWGQNPSVHDVAEFLFVELLLV